MTSDTELDDVLELEPAPFNNPEEAHSKISLLGPTVLYSELESLFGHYNQVVVAYENLLAVSMKVK